MSKVIYSKEDQMIHFESESGNVTSFECHDDFEEGFNSEGIPRESLPVGEYVANAEIASYGPSYGTFYITTGDPRARDIHGGGSSLPDPYAPRQGWRCTYGCLRMQNEDGEALCQLMIDNGNNIELTVQQESYA